MKKITAILLVCAMALPLVACSSGSNSSTSNAGPVSGGSSVSSTGSASAGAGDYASLEPVSLILADSAAKGAAGSTFDVLVAEKVAEITGGQLTIDTYINGELGNDTDLLRQMQSGDIDIVGSQVAPLVNFIPEISIFDLPMVFATVDGDTINQVLNGQSQTRAALDASYEKVGWHLLGFLQNATFRLTTSNKELKTLEDFKGLQIRTMENSNHMAFWSAIGAEPTPMAWGEVYFALQSGAIDAQENAADTIVGANINEVQTNLSCTNHILYLNQLSMNQASWEALDPLYQTALEQAVSEAIEVMRQELVKIDTENKAVLVENGMTITEYDNAFFEKILTLPGVQNLYAQIDKTTGGLASTLQSELNG